MPPTLKIQLLHSIPQKPHALEILSQINRIERKTFPASEAFDFSEQSLWRRKPNTHILFATLSDDTSTLTPTSTSTPRSTTITTTTSSSQNAKTPTTSTPSCPTIIIAYALYVRHRDTALLHKICVAEPFRGQGFGKQLLAYVIEQQLRRQVSGCLAVQLWVDEKREVARRLYGSCGFVEVEGVEDYYGPGRKGVRMVLGLDGDGDGEGG
ncbi:hypothetical protein AJ78_08608 [Emergomyces pasteurianus Ep9510]|uniref:N-acetyltransferase domain-containing protein n=1 Tax=Emergomyces pasteurianus Ep9510 TaxID=1447872 RepID=A0A1J9Q340_9EURO|nr:hypothetical protein AJ78_08608 [Emergomyces pasteurianus Ep9510]